MAGLQHYLTQSVREFSKICAIIMCFLAISVPAKAQRISLVRDAEIEALLKDYTAPIFKAAGLHSKAVDVMIVGDSSFNAFVSTRYMFIHTGAILQTKTPNQLIGIIAHETGHIVGGHQQRMQDRIERAKALSLFGMILGAGAMASGSEGGRTVGSAIVSGGRASILNSLLAYQRDEETSADRAAMRLLEKTGQSGRGMIETFKTIDRNALFTGSETSFLRTHPLPRERITMLENLVTTSPNFRKTDSALLQLRHDMARAKIAAYQDGMRTARAIFKKDLSGAPARYGLAISHFLRGSTTKALKIIDPLIGEQPKNAYLYEMKAEILYRAGRAREAAQAITTAIKLDRHNSAILRVLYGRILLDSGAPDQAIDELKRAIANDNSMPDAYGFLARAYAGSGNEAMANAATAEQRFLSGKYGQAKQFALRAQQKLKKNSPEWLRMQDIARYKPKKKKR